MRDYYLNDITIPRNFEFYTLTTPTVYASSRPKFKRPYQQIPIINDFLYTSWPKYNIVACKYRVPTYHKILQMGVPINLVR